VNYFLFDLYLNLVLQHKHLISPVKKKHWQAEQFPTPLLYCRWLKPTLLQKSVHFKSWA